MQITLNQRTKAWYQHRRNYINASEIASITKLDPFRSVHQLIHDKLFGTTFSSNKYTEHGVKMEPIARQFFINKTNLNFIDTIFTDDKEKIFSASLDGYNEKNKIVLEIKCPYLDENNSPSSTWTQFLQLKTEESIPKYYWAQIQCQLYCSEAQFAYFLVFFNDTDFHVVRVKPNPTYFKKMIQMSREYLQLLNEARTELNNTSLVKKLSKFYKE